MNNMLTAIRGFAELLQEDLEREPLPRTDELRHSVDAIRSAADRAAALAAQLITFSRGQLRAPVALNLAIAVRTIEPMLRSLIGKQTQLVMRPDPDTGMIRADPGQIDQVVINLIINAIDGMPDGGTARIETSNVNVGASSESEHLRLPPGRYVMLSVSHTGSDEDREIPKLTFDPFSATEQGPGAGSGIAAVHGIVLQSGGHVRIHSEAGQGATFSVYFPRIELTEEEVQIPATPEARSQSGTVLVVEDDGALREYTARVLERKGFRILAVRDAVGARHELDGAEPIEVVVTDVVLPGLSGPQLAAQLVADHLSIGLVLVSGYTAEDLQLAELLERGAIFVAKPFTPLDLSRAVVAAMASPLSHSG